MKIIRPLISLLFLLILIYLIGSNLYMLQAKQDRLLCVPNDYQVAFSKETQLPEGNKITVYGLTSRNLNNMPASYLVVCLNDRENHLLYRYAPLVPPSVDYPRPLMFEKAEVIVEGEELYIISSWGETGADYFGAHPILIKYSHQKFKTVKFYKGYLSDSPRIRHIPWTRKDFEVINCYDHSDAVFTILTQAVTVVNNNMIELDFYGDSKAHAAEHQYVKFAFPLPNTDAAIKTDTP